MSRIHDEKHRRDLVLRLKRVEGQLRGIQAMIESAADCEKIVHQLSASRRALDKAFYNLLACAIQAQPAGSGSASCKTPGQQRLKQAAELLAKFG